MRKILLILGIIAGTALSATNKEIKEVALSATIYNNKITQEHMSALIDVYADATGEPADSALDRAAITFELSVGLKGWSDKLRHYANSLNNRKLDIKHEFNELINLYAKETGKRIDTSCQKGAVGLNASTMLDQWASKLRKYSEDLTIKAFKGQSVLD